MYCTTTIVDDYLIEDDEMFFEAFYDELLVLGNAHIVPLSIERVIGETNEH